MSQEILEIFPIDLHYPTQDPFLFCAHHLDFYPEGDGNLRPKASLVGRNLGNDFTPKDGWRMYHGREVPGFPVHPHRGFETITIVEQGIVDHTDSYGGKARYSEGEVQWMTAGRGIQHSEMFPLVYEDKPNTLELFQIWLNLPAKNKMVVPEFQIFSSSSIPNFTLLDDEGKKVKIKLISGIFANYNSAVYTKNSWASIPENEVLIFIAELEPFAILSIPPSLSLISRSLYFYNGKSAHICNTSVTSKHGVFVHPKAHLVFQNGEEHSKILFLQGKPILEPIVNYGPFVMNTKEEIYEAIRDFQNQKFGTWEFDSLEPTHAKREKFVEYGKP